nr:NADH dehydrogenase subunit 5 [Aspidomorpha difformis]
MLCFKFSLFLLLFSLLTFFSSLFVLSTNFSMVLELQILSINSSKICVILLVDWISLLFSSFVFLISLSVLIYSKDYMCDEINFNRFIFLVMMFIFSMMLMIFSPNLISIMLGWDGLGLISYCLVIYYQNEKSLNAGMLTLLSNRIGDVFLLMSIVWMLNFGSWNFIFYLNLMSSDYIMKMVIILVFLASVTKSAQIPFSAWLPAAMAAPTPVSSLVHSSTLVTAGVYLMIRFSEGLNLFMMTFMLFMSVFTMFMAGLIACFEYDLKKIIAMSTLSQLGLMMSILFVGDYELAFFHLLIHALFKALLFMCAGYIIHSFKNCQDIRFMGSMVYILPLTSSYFFICLISLCGLPFMSGFYSKDLIVEILSMSYTNLVIYYLYLISLSLTVIYSIRLLTYLIKFNFNHIPLNVIYESKDFMIYGMSILIFFVVFSGSMLMWLMLNPYFVCLPLVYKTIIMVILILSIYFGYMLFLVEYFYYSKILLNYKFCMFTGLMFNLSYISTMIFSYIGSFLSKEFNNKLDQGWFEYYGFKGLFKNLYVLIQFFQMFSINNMKVFLIICLFLLFLVVFFIYL